MTNTYSTKVRTFSQLSSWIHPYNPNTQGRRMLAEIITEGNLIQHHPVINAAGMEQMQSPILVPYGQAQMTHVESFLLGNKCQDIAISDAREFLAATSCQTGGVYISRQCRCTASHTVPHAKPLPHPVQWQDRHPYVHSYNADSVSVYP